MSVAIDDTVPKAYYAAIGYRICATRAVRVDMLERLADTIRPLIAWRPAEDGAAPLEGALGKGRFAVTPAMLSLVGCSGEDFAEVLKAIGFRRDGELPPAGAVASEPPAPDASASEPPDGDPGTAANEAPAVETPTHESRETREGEAADAPRGRPGGSAAALGVWRVRPVRPKRPRVAAEKAKTRATTPPSQAPAWKNARQKRIGKADRPTQGRARAEAAKRPDRKPAAADPLSPFAALADLKRELEGAAKSGRKG
jgi:ATP-dependent RNA helicase SUPV3L1/SUV3